MTEIPVTIPGPRDFDVLGFGTNAVDFLIIVPEYPEFDSKIELTNYVQAAGGEIATSMVGLSRLGLKTAYAGRFGKEPTGDFGLESLVSEGVDVSYSEQIEGAVTQIAFILIDERNGERTVIWKRDEKLSFTEEEAPVAAVERSRILHLTPHDTRACIRLAETARDCGTLVSIDLDNLFEGIEELLPLVDVLICSSDFPQRMFDIGDPREGLVKLAAKYECPIVGTTLGASGSLLLVNGEFHTTAGFAVPGGCKDTTGAGDSFRAGLLYGILNGMSLEESAEAANAVAALKCREVGARTSLPTKEEVAELIRSGDRNHPH